MMGVMFAPFRRLTRPLAPLLAAALLLCCAGCASVANLKADPATDTPQAQGDVKVQFLPDPARVAPNLLEGEEFVPPHPIVTPLPLYPAGHTEPRPVVVVLRFVVGKTGVVEEVEDSPLRDPGEAGAGAVGSDAGGSDGAFRAAAEDALRSWRFVPAAIQTVKPGADLDHDSKPDYTVLVASTRVPVYLDVRFTFEMVAGEGRVRVD
jgi:hypothetical protein